MSKGRSANNHSTVAKVVWLIVLSLLLAAALLFIYFHSESEVQMPLTPTDGQLAQTDGGTQPEETDSGATTVDVTEEPAETVGKVPTEPLEPSTEPTIVLEQQIDAEYEKWLGAAMVVCVSMEYPDFELTGIYAASATSLENKMSSAGAYILFTSGGKAMAIHSLPLETERTAAGTKDISTQALGFATFDHVDPASVKAASMEELKVEDLSDLINQSLLISIYTH